MLYYVQNHVLFCGGVAANFVWLALSIVMMFRGKNIYHSVFFTVSGFIGLNLCFAALAGVAGASQWVAAVGGLIILAVVLFVTA